MLTHSTNSQFDSGLPFPDLLVMPIARKTKPIARNVRPVVGDEWVTYALVIMITAARPITIADTKSITLVLFVLLFCFCWTIVDFEIPTIASQGQSSVLY